MVYLNDIQIISVLLFVSQNRYSQHMDDEQQLITGWENLGTEAVCDERMKAGES